MLILYPLLWLRIINDPAQRTAIDFLPFYAAGRIAITQGMSKVYDWEAQRLAENEVVNETLIQYFASRGRTLTPQDLGPDLQPSEVHSFPHPPFIIPLLIILAHLDYVPAFVIWSILMSILFIISAAILIRLVPQASKRDRLILFFGTLLFFPAFFSIINGQDSAVLLLGASIWAFSLMQGSDRLSGIGLALTLIRPHLSIILAPPFIFKRRRVWWWFCVGGSILVLASLLLVGRAGAEGFIRILTANANNEGYMFFNENLMVNLIGFLRRAFPSVESSLIRSVGWIGYAVSIIYLCYVWIRTGEIKERHIGLAIIVTILGSPHFHYHDLVLLLIPIYGAMRTMLDKKFLKTEEAVLIPLGVSLLLFISYLLLPIFKYVVPYLMMIIVLAGLWFPEKIAFWQRKKIQE